MIPAKGNDPRKYFPSLGQPLPVGISERPAHQDAVVAIFNLLDGPGVVISVPQPSATQIGPIAVPGHPRSHRNIPAVQYLEVIVKGIGFQRHVIPATECQFA
jgi:hypothetical protein